MQPTCPLRSLSYWKFPTGHEGSERKKKKKLPGFQRGRVAVGADAIESHETRDRDELQFDHTSYAAFFNNNFVDTKI